MRNGSNGPLWKMSCHRVPSGFLGACGGHSHGANLESYSVRLSLMGRLRQTVEPQLRSRLLARRARKPPARCHDRTIEQKSACCKMFVKVTGVRLHQSPLLVRHVLRERRTRRDQLEKVVLFGHGTENSSSHNRPSSVFPARQSVAPAHKKNGTGDERLKHSRRSRQTPPDCPRDQSHKKRAPVHPCMFGGFDFESQPLKSLQFVCKIGESYRECNVVNCGGRCVGPTIAGVLGAVEQGEHLSVSPVAVRNLKKRAGRISWA